MRLMDERSVPPLRTVIGGLLESSRTADLALSRVRLAALDLSAAEVAGPERCRVLLGQLDAAALLDATLDPASRSTSPTTPDPGPERGSTRKSTPGSTALDPGAPLRRLREWLESGRLEVRSAGIGAWTPDFSLYRLPGQGSLALVGSHYFGSPHLTVGPSFTVVVTGVEHGRMLARRFAELWARGHDVGPAIHDVLVRAGGHAAADP